MKYLVLLAVLIGVVWWLRQSGRHRTPTPPGPNASPSDSPQDMVSCTHCQVHVPRSDAIAGACGLYCCTQHQQQHEG